MPKFFHMRPEDIGTAKPLKEDAWFTVFQPLLLEMVNTEYGRDLMCVDQGFPKIVEFSKRHIRGQIGDNLWLSQFQIGSKWANVIRYRWPEFKRYAKLFYERNRGNRHLFNVGGQLVALNASDTFFPDEDPETSSVDGVVTKGAFDGAAQTWANIRDAASGDTANDDGDDGFLELDGHATVDRWSTMSRLFFVFDTSVIPSTNTIVGAFFSCFATGTDVHTQFVFLLDWTDRTSDTSLVVSDYNGAFTDGVSSSVQLLANMGSSIFYTWVLSTAGLPLVITAGQKSAMQMRLSGDTVNFEPTYNAGRSFLQVFMRDFSLPGTDPFFEVQHFGAGGVSLDVPASEALTLEVPASETITLDVVGT